MTEQSKPTMPISTLISETCGDSSSDYNDGENCGYYHVEWSESEQVLRIRYEPDTSGFGEDLQPPYAETVVTFRLVET